MANLPLADSIIRQPTLMASSIYYAPDPFSTYNISPSPTTGQGAFGAVPGQVGIPPNVYQQLASVYPGLAGETATTSDLINSQLAGEFSPQTENALWDTANRFGVAAGMPGAGIWGNKFMGNVAGAKEALQQKGLENFQNVQKTLGGMMTDPNLAAQIALRNATMKAAPDPTQAGLLQLQQFWAALMAGRGMGGRGPAGGTGGGGGLDPVFQYMLGSSSPSGGTMPKPIVGTDLTQHGVGGGGTTDTSGVTASSYDPTTGLYYDPETGLSYPGPDYGGGGGGGSEADAWLAMGVDPSWFNSDSFPTE